MEEFSSKPYWIDPQEAGHRPAISCMPAVMCTQEVVCAHGTSCTVESLCTHGEPVDEGACMAVPDPSLQPSALRDVRPFYSGFAPSGPQGGSSRRHAANFRMHRYDTSCKEDQEDFVWSEDDSQPHSRQPQNLRQPDQVSNGRFAPASRKLSSNACKPQEMQPEGISSLISSPNSAWASPRGTLNHVELLKRLKQLEKLRQVEEKRHPVIPGRQKESCVKLSFWPSLRSKHTELDVIFTSRPLGISFERGKMPCVVSALITGSVAINLGVKKGMVIKSIDDDDVTNMVYEEFYEFFVEKCNALRYLSPRLLKLSAPHTSIHEMPPTQNEVASVLHTAR